VHVSGCAKGCARQEKAPVTLVGRDGRYDLVLSGTAADTPVRTGLGRDEVGAALRALADNTQGIPA
jgi:precorrin-3B synthase